MLALAELKKIPILACLNDANLAWLSQQAADIHLEPGEYLADWARVATLRNAESHRIDGRGCFRGSRWQGEVKRELHSGNRQTQVSAAAKYRCTPEAAHFVHQMYTDSHFLRFLCFL